jgi:hypothetical protein
VGHRRCWRRRRTPSRGVSSRHRRCIGKHQRTTLASCCCCCGCARRWGRSRCTCGGRILPRRQGSTSARRVGRARRCCILKHQRTSVLCRLQWCLER